jgi:hypothetical protein
MMQTPIKIYFCPSLRDNEVHYRDTVGTRAMIDYAGNGGTYTPGDPTTERGCPGRGLNGAIARQSFAYPINFNAFTDGLSNTMMVGERCYDMARMGTWGHDDDQGFSAGWDMDNIRWGNELPLPNQRGDGSELWGDGNRFWHRFGSAHSSGFQCVLADGSVRGVRYGVSLPTFQALCVRNDGVPFNPDDL